MGMTHVTSYDNYDTLFFGELDLPSTQQFCLAANETQWKFASSILKSWGQNQLTNKNCDLARMFLNQQTYPALVWTKLEFRRIIIFLA